MTKKRRVLNFLTGTIMIAAAVALAVFVEYGIGIVLFILTVGFFVAGAKGLGYYFTMARNMVGGRSELYRAILMLDLGVFTYIVANHGVQIGILYVAILQLVTGVIEVLNATDSRKVGSTHWKITMAHGVISILFAIAIVYSGTIMKSPVLAVYVYAAGLAYSGIAKMASAFQKTAIVYVQ